MVVYPRRSRTPKWTRYVIVDTVVIGLILGGFFLWYDLTGHEGIMGGWRLVPVGLTATYLAVRPFVHRQLARLSGQGASPERQDGDD
jgi:hypothetical protein